MDAGSATICTPAAHVQRAHGLGTASASGAPGGHVPRAGSRRPSEEPFLLAVDCQKVRSLILTRSPPPSNPRRNLVRLDTTLATDAHNDSCSSSDRPDARRGPEVQRRGAAFTFASACSSTARWFARSNARERRQRRVPLHLLTDRAELEPGFGGAQDDLERVRAAVDPASTTTTCRGASPHIASADASTYDDALPRARADAKTRRAAKTAPRSKPQMTIAR